MTKLSTTLLAVVVATSPFLAQAFSFSRADFEIQNVPEGWAHDTLKSGIKELYVNTDAGEVKGVINQIHDYENAKFMYLGRPLEGTQIGDTMQGMINEGIQWETEISSAQCIRSDSQKVVVQVQGKMTMKVWGQGNQPEDLLANITFVKGQNPPKISHFERFAAALQTKANVSQ